MINRIGAATFGALLALLATAGAGLPQQAAEQPPIAANAPPVPYSATMGDMMNTLVQPRHAKLGIAGQAENWPLAAYALRETRQSFDKISKAIPRWRGLPIPDMFEAALGEAFEGLQSAIQQQSRDKFKEAFDTLTRGCNACHANTYHPFVVIKTPNASVFPNQDFGGR